MKTIRRILSIVLSVAAVLVILLLSSCASDVPTKKYLVYYINNAGDNIVYREYSIEGWESMSCQELTEVLLKRLFDTEFEDNQVHSAKPAEVNILDFTADNNLITFNFDRNYLNMTNVEEILLRAALVLTMIQQSDSMQVAFTIEGVPLTDSTGQAIGNMDADNFVDILLTEEGMLKQETDLELFFTDETGTILIPAMYHFTINNSNLSMEEYILQQLKTGPAIDSTYRTLGADVEIISVLTSYKDKICYVNFGSNFLDQEQTVSDDILIYSIVNSLCSLPYVDCVQFLVEGKSDVRLHTVTDLSEPFWPNKGLEQR